MEIVIDLVADTATAFGYASAASEGPTKSLG